jgi:alanine racemase
MPLEALSLRQTLPLAEIFSLCGPITVDTIPVLKLNRITPVLNSIEEVDLWRQHAGLLRRKSQKIEANNQQLF